MSGRRVDPLMHQFSVAERKVMRKALTLEVDALRGAVLYAKNSGSSKLEELQAMCESGEHLLTRLTSLEELPGMPPMPPREEAHRDAQPPTVAPPED